MKFYSFIPKRPIYAVLVIVFGVVSCEGQESNSNPYKGDDYRTSVFDAIEGVAAKVIIKTIEVTDIFECMTHCLRHFSCQSFNFQIMGNPKYLCELSDTSVVSSPLCQERRPGYKYYYAPKSPNNTDCVTYGKKCQNGASCVLDQCGRTLCQCQPYNKGKYCQHWTMDVLSCKDILNKTSYKANGAYSMLVDNKLTEIYCHLADDICGGGGWTMVIKMDGTIKSTFEYSSPLWSNKDSYNLTAGQTGFDNYQTKMPSYWAMPFQKLCVGFKINNVLKWAVIPYRASSLYDVIAHGRFRNFTIGKPAWMSLMHGTGSLQQNCNQEGFNNHYHARIGIRANQEDDCNTCDSALGFGLRNSKYSCGNKCRIHCNNGDLDIAAFGYIMLQ